MTINDISVKAFEYFKSGFLPGRTDPETDIALALELTAEFRNEFIRTFGKSKCQGRLDVFGPLESDQNCSEFTEKTTAILVELLTDYGIQSLQK